MLDLQHVPNKKDGKRLIKGFNTRESIVIAIPSSIHFMLKPKSFENVQNARTLLAREIREIKKVSLIPNVILQKIIDLNKSKYPQPFKK